MSWKRKLNDKKHHMCPMSDEEDSYWENKTGLVQNSPEITQSELQKILKPYCSDRGFCGIEIGDGWCALALELHNEILKYAPDYKITQIKEKFGGLRYYVEWLDKYIFETVHNLISDYEEKAACTCEQCGSEGRLASFNGWVQTVCQKCFDERSRGKSNCRWSDE